MCTVYIYMTNIIHLLLVLYLVTSSLILTHFKNSLMYFYHVIIMYKIYICNSLILNEIVQNSLCKYELSCLHYL